MTDGRTMSPSRTSRATLRVASDIGGTFTDVVCYEIDAETGELRAIRTEKAHTTSPQFEDGVLDALTKAGIDVRDVDDFFANGTTVVINAITERRGVKTALITTRGFRDILEIARGDRPDFFNIRYHKPPPFVPRHLRLEISERIDHQGKVLAPLELGELPALVSSLKAEGVEAVGVCLLNAYANPAHEQALVAALERAWPQAIVVASHQVTRMWREYERTNTTVLSAYVRPITQRYLDGLQSKLRQRGLRGSLYIMKSNGGIDTLEAARATPITIIESGPASGVLAAAALGRLIGERNVIALDIGGTTAKCSLVDDGRVQVVNTYHIDRSRLSSGYPLLVSVVDIVEIGNGGGSIAWLDSQGKLHVGPRSAGALPGPVAYGKGGTEPTTTDANLLTGRINQASFCGGELDADMAGVRAAFTRLGERLGLPAQEAARGVIRIANNNMVNALRLVSINRGYDPRDFVLFAFGGGGALHAVTLARELNIPRVVIPPHSAVFSAWGMLMSDLRRDWVLTQPTPLTAPQMSTVNSSILELERLAAEAFAASGYERAQLRFERMADMRYEGQEHTVRMALPFGPLDESAYAPIADAFHAHYERQYTYRLESPIELVSYHVAAFAPVPQPRPKVLASGRGVEQQALRGRRQVDYDEEGLVEAAIYDRAQLGAGARLTGPAIIEEAASCAVIPPGLRAHIDDYGNLHIETRPRGEASVGTKEGAA
jgi:N-methylhydantoinase A